MTNDRLMKNLQHLLKMKVNITKRYMKKLYKFRSRKTFKSTLKNFFKKWKRKKGKTFSTSW